MLRRCPPPLPRRNKLKGLRIFITFYNSSWKKEGFGSLHGNIRVSVVLEVGANARTVTAMPCRNGECVV